MMLADRRGLAPRVAYKQGVRNVVKKVKIHTQDLEAAINDIKSGLPKNAAAKKHNVPRAAIQFNLKQNFVKSRPDPNTILTDEEEITLKNWIIDSCRKGFPRRKADVIASVKEFLHNRPNQFIDNTPASGLVVPPMVVFLYKRIPAEIGHSVPDSWGIGHSDRGWMKTEVFYERLLIFQKNWKNEVNEEDDAEKGTGEGGDHDGDHDDVDNEAEENGKRR
ncbi:hypothetical protein ANN_11070 [Periplaneta americana]|uniref:HTH psq-type domain-containing protein n=1 Tax=Periplaneta americana TaxID=6978 RepID=A0ABQ8T406_PERAM|nr:hypothetical protein ANN_11070 [Periplaneta americana]